MSTANHNQNGTTLTIHQGGKRSFPVFCDDRTALMVIGHERSGNHFLINTLASCYGHINRPWMDLDYQTFNINFHKPLSVAKVLQDVGRARVASVIKSHHQYDFFEEHIENILAVIKIIYIYRNPADVMISLWRLLHGLPWHEGPRTTDPLSLARSQPSGQLMRYQAFQHESMLHRWESHVSKWLAAAAHFARITTVSYEQLDQNFEMTVSSLSSFMGRPPDATKRPSRTEDVVNPGPLSPEISQHEPDREALFTYCCQRSQKLMQTLGYVRPTSGKQRCVS